MKSKILVSLIFVFILNPVCSQEQAQKLSTEEMAAALGLVLQEQKQKLRYEEYMLAREQSANAVKNARKQADQAVLNTLAIDYVHLTPGDLIELKKAISYLIKAEKELMLTRNAQAVFDSILEQLAKINQAGVERRARMDQAIWEQEALEFLQNIFALIQANAKPVDQKWGVGRQQKYSDEEIFNAELAAVD